MSSFAVASPEARAIAGATQRRGLLSFHGRMDWALFCTVLALSCFGLVMIYSASSVSAEIRYGKTVEHFLIRQGIAAAASLLVMLWLAMWDYRKLCSPRWAFAAPGLVLIGLVVVYFADARHRWLPLPFFQIQPSEFAKPALGIFLAWFAAHYAPRINEWRIIARAGLLVGVLAYSVLAADVGTVVVLCAMAGAVLFVAGLDRRWLMAAALLATVAISAMIIETPYRLLRVLVFLGPNQVLGYVSRVDPHEKLLRVIDPTGVLKKAAAREGTPEDPAYQVNQSLIAVGTGGMFGAGLMQGKQKLLYLPEAHTDFIFAIVCEELGLVMAALLLAAYMAIMWRGYRLFWTSADEFGRYLAVGLTTGITVQALINMSVVLKLVPAKGLTLPLISYGGSSLLVTLIMFGLLLSVSERAAGDR